MQVEAKRGGGACVKGRKSGGGRDDESGERRDLESGRVSEAPAQERLASAFKISWLHVTYVGEHVFLYIPHQRIGF